MAIKTLDPIAEFRMLKEQQTKLAEQIKSKLEHQLAEAGETLNILLELGFPEVLKEPAIAARVDAFQLATNKKTKTPRDSSGRVDAFSLDIVRRAGKPLSADEIIKAVGDKFPGEKVKKALESRSKGKRPWFKIESGKYSPIK